MDEYGIAKAGKVAHFATNVVVNESSYKVFADGVIIDIFYDFGYRTVLQVNVENGVFTTISVLEDTHWYPAFDYVHKLAFFENEYMDVTESKNVRSVKDYYENLYGIPTTQFSKEQLATALFFYTWVEYVSSKSAEEIQEVKFENLLNPRKIGHIHVYGNSTFRDRIERALNMIKRYTPEVYYKNFNNSSVEEQLVHIIAPIDSTFSTIYDGGVIALAKIYETGNDLEVSDVKTASVLIHEMTHLRQRYDRSLQNMFNKVIKYPEVHYADSPKTIADNEIEAYNASTEFLDKLPNNFPGKDKVALNIWAKVKVYENLYRANDLVNSDATRTEGCAIIDRVAKKLDRKKMGDWLKNFYCK